MRHFNYTRKFGKSPVLAVAAIAMLSMSLAHAEFGDRMKSGAKKTENVLKKSSYLVGAGATSYIAETSPATGFSMDARMDTPLKKSPWFAEGSASTAFTSSANNDGTTIPMLLDASLKMKALQSAKTNLYGAAGLGYGAYFGTQGLEDGATLGIPLSVGADFKGKRASFSPRFTYRPVFNDDLGPDNAQADSWTAVLDVRIPFI